MIGMPKKSRNRVKFQTMAMPAAYGLIHTAQNYD